MLTRVLLILLILSLSLNFIQWQTTENRNTVITVPDGDSLDLADGRRIRLLGIDAPERGRCMADEARLFLMERAKGKHVRLKETITDDYGRTLAIVIKDDVRMWIGYLVRRFHLSDLNFCRICRIDDSDPLLNRAMVRAGLARNRSSTSSQYHQVLTESQEVARSAKLGIWSDACRAKTSGNDDCAIKGNTRAGEKRYYLPTCKQYDQVLVDTAFGDVWFCTEDQAQSADFAKAPSCPHN